jgi:RNA polymerase sigma factor (sigma-70 family)
MNLPTPSDGQDFRTDPELMIAFCEGDSRAFEVLYGRHNQPLFRRLFALSGDVQRAEDAAQEAWHTVVAKRGSFKTSADSSFGAWLRTIGYRKLVDGLRRGRHDQTHGFEEPGNPADLESDLPEPISELVRRESVDRLRDAIDRLRPDDRVYVVLRYLEGYSVRDIAEMLGVTLMTAYSRLRAALNGLKVLLGERGL